LDEASVIALVRAGNIDAFAEIVERYQAPIQRYLYRLTGDYEEAQDLAQDTFVQAYKRILRTNADLSFKAWLYQIATYNAYQHRRRKRLLSFIPLFSSKEEKELPVQNRVNETDDSITIQEVLGKMPEQQRICLLLHLVEGFKYREIAETLGISEDAVRMRVARGKETFQRLYRRGETL
jgi:RNA polymerase sigma-70 factor (ECF subfamily)